MASLTKTDTNAIEQAVAYPRGFGYVLDFSDKTMGEFFEDEFGIDIYSEEYLVNGSSKRNCLSTFLKSKESEFSLRVLRGLWEIREGLLAGRYDDQNNAEISTSTERFRKVIEKLEGDPSTINTEGIDQFTRDRTLEELILDIERTLAANKPEVAIDHLHTYCTKKITHLLKLRRIDCTHEEPLHSRFGKYRNVLLREQELHEFSDRALKNIISLMESFNDLRNNHSLAHDNKILNNNEARFIFSSISAVLVLIRALESGRYTD